VGSILLVDADPETGERLASTLRDANHEVIIAHVATDATQRLAEGGIDVVVIDAYDPRVGTIELARYMDGLPDTPPIVLVSGSRHAPEISARIGAAAFVPKPVDLVELAAIVSRLAGNARPVRSIDELGDEFADEDPTGPARHAG
jgi:DNA-binding NtrC family response regulator